MTTSTNSSPDAAAAEKSTITKINFALHPKRQLRLSFHRAIPANPHDVVNQLLHDSSILPPSLSKSGSDGNDASDDENPNSNSNSDYFAIMDASKIVCMDQIAIGANNAQLRRYQFSQRNKQRRRSGGNGVNGSSSVSGNAHGSGFENGNGKTNDKQNTTSNTARLRGLALETILCCAGSTNTASVLRDYAFDEHSEAAKSASNTTSSTSLSDVQYDIFVLGFCETDEEFEHVITNDLLKLSPAEDRNGIESYFQRERCETEMNNLLKVYKLTKDEVGMCGSSLEKAVCNRVAAKFFI